MKPTINIVYVVFALVAMVQCVFITLRLIGIMSDLANITPSGPYLFYLIGTVIFQCVVNVVLSLIFRNNTLLSRRMSLTISTSLLIYQAIIILGLLTAVILMTI